MNSVEPRAKTEARNGNAGGDWERPVLACAAVALALGAQVLVDARAVRPTALGLGVALYALAAALFVAAAWPRLLERPGADAPPGQARPHWRWLLPTLALGALAFWRLGANEWTLDGTLLWLAGFAPLWALAGRGRAGQRGRALRASGLALSWDWVALAGILLAAGFLRLYRIGAVPLEMGCDLPLIQGNVAQLLQGELPIFFTAHPGREGLYFYLAAPVAAVFGLGHVTIKVMAALLGLISLPLLYLVGRELFDRRVGLWAALLGAASHWQIMISRAGFRSSTLPPVLLGMWLALARAVRTGSLRAYLVGGLLLGLSLYTYNAAMLAPAFALGLALLALCGERARRPSAQQWALTACAAAYALIPLARYVSHDPGYYFYRAATRLTDIEAPIPTHLLGVFLGNLGRTLAMFNATGDAVFINNAPFHRELGLVTAACFVLGVAYLLVRLRRGRSAWVLWALLVWLMPSALALAFPHEAPNAGRAIGAWAPAMLCAALPLAALHGWARELALGRGRRRVLAVVLAVALLIAATGELVGAYRLYFGAYVQSLPGHNDSVSLRIARAADAYVGNGQVYLKAWPYWYDGNAVRAQLRRLNQDDLHDLTAFSPDAPPLDGSEERALTLLHPADEETLRQLRATWPASVVVTQNDLDGAPALILFYGERTH